MSWMQQHTQRQQAQIDHASRYHKGFLLKRGKLVHSWKRRYFELIGSVLHYYESPMHSHQSGKEFHKQVGRGPSIVLMGGHDSSVFPGYHRSWLCRIY
jgi:hypothetical protein